MGQIPILLINLDRAPERLARMRARFDELGLDFQRVETVDRKTAPPELFTEFFPKPGPLGELSTGDMACTLSHRNAWKLAVELGAKATLILEDDASLSPQLAELVADDGWIPEGASLVKLDRHGNSRHRVLVGKGAPTPFAGRTLHRLFSKHVGGAGYIITRRGAELALQRSRTMGLPIDHFLFNPNNSPAFAEFRPLQILPALVQQALPPGEESDIMSTRVSERPPFFQYWWRETVRGWYEVRLVPALVVRTLMGARLVKVEYSD